MAPPEMFMELGVLVVKRSICSFFVAFPRSLQRTHRPLPTLILLADAFDALRFVPVMMAVEIVAGAVAVVSAAASVVQFAVIAGGAASAATPLGDDDDRWILSRTFL